MKTIVQPAQQRLFDPFEGVISGAEWKVIETGWQSMFRSVLLERMPVGRLSQGMSEEHGRPSAELYSILGLLLNREFQGWTVPQAHEAVLFRSDVQYALNLEPGYEITQRTIERYLQRKSEYASEKSADCPSLLPLPTGGVTFCEDMAVGRGPG